MGSHWTTKHFLLKISWYNKVFLLLAISSPPQVYPAAANLPQITHSVLLDIEITNQFKQLQRMLTSVATINREAIRP
jgi:hypothetical protein